MFCFKRVNNKRLLLIYLVAFFSFLIIVFFYLFHIKSNCSEWAKGLNNTYLENNTINHGCQINIPKICAFKIFNKIQDHTKLRRIDCKNFNIIKLREKLIKESNSPYINNSSKRFGFPLTNKDSICLDYFSDGDPIYKYVLDNLVDMDNKEILHKYFNYKLPEIEIDFTDDDIGKLIVDVKFNKTLSDERKLLESNSNLIQKIF